MVVGGGSGRPVRGAGCRVARRVVRSIHHRQLSLLLPWFLSNIIVTHHIAVTLTVASPAACLGWRGVVLQAWRLLRRETVRMMSFETTRPL